jgi:predicted TIM-barrel fold metal-dependent hydrolase
MTSGPIVVDVHMHLYESKAIGEWWKAGYEIFEYGEKPDVPFGPFSGDVDDAVTALATAGYAHGVAVNLFSIDLFRAEAASALPEGLSPDERAGEIRRIEEGMPDRMRTYNRWLVDTLAPIAQLTPFVAVDPWALTPAENVEHLSDMAGRGAKGIKLHPVVQRFEPNDPRMRPVYEACRDMGLVVLSHTGAAKGGETFAEPDSFAPLLREVPGLKVVLAHLGGGRWRQTGAFAAAFPDVAFDICEVIEWTGAPNAPTREELAHLVASVGSERVMLGTDFPWYDLERTVELVMDLPGLARADKERILGENAARILGLPV